MLNRATEEILQWLSGVDDAALRDLKHHGLGPIDRLGDIVGKVVAHLRDLARDVDEPPQQRVLLDDAGVVRSI